MTRRASVDPVAEVYEAMCEVCGQQVSGPAEWMAEALGRDERGRFREVGGESLDRLVRETLAGAAELEGGDDRA
ncbi:hypothetical protein [Streptomyces sp. NPDC002156]